MGQNQSNKSEEPTSLSGNLVPHKILPEKLYVIAIEDEGGCTNVPLYLSLNYNKAKKMFDKTSPDQWSGERDGIRKYLIETNTEEILNDGLLGAKKLEIDPPMTGGGPKDVDMPKAKIIKYVYIVAIEDKKGCKDMPIFISQDHNKAAKIYKLIKPDQYVKQGMRKYIVEVPLNRIIKQGFACENPLISDPPVSKPTCEQL